MRILQGSARISGVMCALMVLIGGCGGGGGGSTNNNPPPNPLTITTASLPATIVGQMYTTQLRASGGTAPYTWSLDASSGPLPQGLAIAADGTISGTATQSVAANVVVRVQDAKSAVKTRALTLQSIATLAFTAAGDPTAIPDGNLSTLYVVTLGVTGGVAPYTFTLASGALPAGMQLDGAHGTVTGVPTATGNFSFSLKVTDSGSISQSATHNFTLRILGSLTVPSIGFPNGEEGVAYSNTLTAVGGTPPYHWSVDPSGQLPAGLQINASTGAVTGTPTVNGLYNIKLRVTDSATPTAASFLVQTAIIINPALVFATDTLPDGATTDYDQPLVVAGGKPPYTLVVSSGTLPNGLQLTVDAQGGQNRLAGVPTKTGLFTFTLKATDSFTTKSTATKTYSIRISSQLKIPNATGIAIVEGQNYSVTYNVTGGFPPYTWSATDVPAGFTFDTTSHTLSGVAGPPGTSDFSVQVLDSSSPPLQVDAFISMQIYSKLSSATKSLPTIAASRQVWMAPRVTGGTGNYDWTISQGNLPAGLSLDESSGVISGSANNAGTTNFTLRASEASSTAAQQNVDQQLTLTVKNSAQMTRNDTTAQATALSNIFVAATVSPFDDPSTIGPDVDVYSASAPPGSVVSLTISANNLLAPGSQENSLLPVVELVDSSGKRYASCNFDPDTSAPNPTFTEACVNGLDANFLQDFNFRFKMPGSGVTPVTFFVRIADARGDARPDFTYTLGISGVN